MRFAVAEGVVCESDFLKLHNAFKKKIWIYIFSLQFKAMQKIKLFEKRPQRNNAAVKTDCN